MRYDLKTPCKHCPFRSDETRITFACRERAEEIEESAYRNGFPCHRSAGFDDDEDHGGYVATKTSQHCVGYIIMQINEGGSGSPWPGINNDEDLLERLERRVDMKAPVFESSDAFFKANETPRKRRKK